MPIFFLSYFFKKQTKSLFKKKLSYLIPNLKSDQGNPLIKVFDITGLIIIMIKVSLNAVFMLLLLSWRLDWKLQHSLNYNIVVALG